MYYDIIQLYKSHSDTGLHSRYSPVSSILSLVLFLITSFNIRRYHMEISIKVLVEGIKENNVIYST